MKQQTAESADMPLYLFDSHELSSVVVEAQVDSAKGSCPNHLPNLPIDLFTDWEALHATGCHSTAIRPTGWYTVCKGSCLSESTKVGRKGKRNSINKQGMTHVASTVHTYCWRHVQTKLPLVS